MIDPPCVRCWQEKRLAFDVRVVVVHPCSVVEVSAAPFIAANSDFAAANPRRLNLLPFVGDPPIEAENAPPGF